MRIFLICLALGVCSGIVYDMLYIARFIIGGRPAVKIKKREIISCAVCDIIYAAVLSALFVAASVLFCFPDVRLYMLAAVISGELLYIKSFHIMVAFFLNRLYNIVSRIAKRGKKGSPGAK